MHRFAPLVIMVLILWLTELINVLMGHELCRWGILPRTLEGLKGIFFSPLLHTSIPHLAINTGPLVILGGAISLQSKKIFLNTTIFIVLIGGGLLWLFGRPAYHVGASSLIFGYFGYLAFRGFFNKNIGALLISVFTLFAYGGFFWSMLPTTSHISWEGHLSGFIAGLLAARLEIIRS